MTITATQYLFRASTFTATTTATMGSTTATTADGYTVPANTRFQIVAISIANTSTANAMAFVDVALFNGTTAYTNLVKAPIFPGGNLVVNGIEKHVLPTSGAVYVTPYATNVSAQMSGVELT